MNWQPIETAPKDEHKDILLWHGRCNVGGWQISWPYDDRSGMTKNVWVINGGYVVKPTHWMSLPEPPK